MFQIMLLMEEIVIGLNKLEQPSEKVNTKIKKRIWIKRWEGAWKKKKKGKKTKTKNSPLKASKEIKPASDTLANISFPTFDSANSTFDK